MFIITLTTQMCTDRYRPHHACTCARDPYLLEFIYFRLIFALANPGMMMAGPRRSVGSGHAAG